MSPRKLMFWLFACIFLVCALRAGLLTSADQYIYHLRNMHASTFAYRYDDFLPYLPIVAMFVLKLTGVKSRSNWKRMLVSTAFSYILMGTIVLTMNHWRGFFVPTVPISFHSLRGIQLRLLRLPHYCIKNMVSRPP